MRNEREFDPLMEWGHQVAVLIFVLALLGAIALLVAAAVTGGPSRTREAALTVAGGAAVGYGIIWLRKRRERSLRPKWMGTTTEWQNHR